MRKKGFTLAEVLITLGIIGVIAAMSIPALKKSIDNSQNKVALKKSYAVLEQASRRVISDQGGSLAGAFDNNSIIMKNLFAQYLNGTKSCVAPEDCDILPRNKVDGSGTSDFGESQVKLFLADGTLLSFAAYTSCDFTIDGISGRDKVCGKIMMDINGERGPNVTGKDVFRVYVLKDRIVPSGSNQLENEGYPGCGCLSAYCGYTCTAKYLYE